MSVNVARFLPESAARVPEHCALKIPRGRKGQLIDYQSFSFAELEGLTNACARYLHERGVGKGDRVQIMVKPGLELILVVFALFKLAAVPVVIDPGIGMKHFLACVKRTKPDHLVGIPAAGLISRIFSRNFPGLKSRISIRKSLVKRLDAMPKDAVLESAEADELAAILFTSGSTGPAKGVLYSHGVFDAQVRLVRDTYGIEPGEVDLPMLPVFALFNPAMGMTTVVPEMNPSKPATVDPAKIVQAIRQNGVTNSFGSPVLWKKINRYCHEQGIELPSMKRVLMAGAPVPESLIRDFKKVIINGEIHTPYGATESLPVSSISGQYILDHTAASARAGKGNCVGKAVESMQVRVIRIVDGEIATVDEVEDLPAGEIGEVIVKGPVVTLGYDHLEGATRRARIADTDGVWHRMGDSGYLDADGRLWFCGRVVERVITLEGPLFTEPVESFFNQQAGVFRSALIGLGDAPEQVPAIVIEPETGHWPGTDGERKAWAKRLLEAAAGSEQASAVKQVFFRKTFPVDVRHNAKIHRLTLKREFS